MANLQAATGRQYRLYRAVRDVDNCWHKGGSLLLYCTVLYCTVLCTLLYSTVLYSVQYSTLLYCQITPTLLYSQVRYSSPLKCLVIFQQYIVNCSQTATHCKIKDNKCIFQRINPQADTFIELRCLSFCLSPFHVTFFETSHWPSDHMIRFQPLIG